MPMTIEQLEHQSRAGLDHGIANLNKQRGQFEQEKDQIRNNIQTLQTQILKKRDDKNTLDSLNKNYYELAGKIGSIHRTIRASEENFEQTKAQRYKKHAETVARLETTQKIQKQWPNSRFERLIAIGKAKKEIQPKQPEPVKLVTKEQLDTIITQIKTELEQGFAVMSSQLEASTDYLSTLHHKE
jgi:hypothetical protein